MQISPLRPNPAGIPQREIDWIWLVFGGSSFGAPTSTGTCDKKQAICIDARIRNGNRPHTTILFVSMILVLDLTRRACMDHRSLHLIFNSLFSLVRPVACLFLPREVGLDPFFLQQPKLRCNNHLCKCQGMLWIWNLLVWQNNTLTLVKVLWTYLLRSGCNFSIWPSKTLVSVAMGFNGKCLKFILEHAA